MLEQLTALYHSIFGDAPDLIEPIAPHASQRQIARLRSSQRTVCGVFNQDIKENEAFLYLAKQFHKVGLPVPNVFGVSDDLRSYLIEDLGDVTLYDLVVKDRSKSHNVSTETERLYGLSLEYLASFQLLGATEIDFSKCYPHHDFNERSMVADMDYFRNHFLSMTSFNFDHGKLQQDFLSFAQYLLEIPQESFMYRDFQSRNIMIKDGKPFFIDFQGGRKGPIHYDVVSILYQSSAQLTEQLRQNLIVRYVEKASSLKPLSKEQFVSELPRFLLIRMLQVLGTYGKVGLQGGKSYFQNSIPLAANNLATLLDAPIAWNRFSYLKGCVEEIVNRYGTQTNGSR